MKYGPDNSRNWKKMKDIESNLSRSDVTLNNKNMYELYMYMNIFS